MCTDGSVPTDVAVLNWAKTYPKGDAFVIDQDLQFEYLEDPASKKVFGLRFWPQGGKKKGYGNVSVYIKGKDDSAVHIVGKKKARDFLRTQVAAWITCSSGQFS
jgi:hypothetical protein